MFYRFIKIIIGIAVRIFFRRIVIVGEENFPADKPIILVSNHPSAFMDPLLLGITLKNPLYFFARADIFKPGFVNWITKKAHVSPIYRIIDGAESLEKNDAVFSSAYELLREKKTLLLFGEGFTDELFIRRVKPMKKGSMRIALGAESKFDFKLAVKIICVGINYSDPNSFRSDVIIRYSSPIDIKNYKDLFLQHNNKAMQELNKEIYSKLKNEVVHVEKAEQAALFEQLLIVSEKGINKNSYEKNVTLNERWSFSKKLSTGFNAMTESNPALLKTLEEKSTEYVSSLNKINITDETLSAINNSSTLFSKMIFLVFGFPVFIFGMLNNFLPVKLSAVLSKMLSKRPVFWRSTDMAFSIFTVPIYYTLMLYLFRHYAISAQPFNIKIILFLIYFVAMPLSGIFTFNYLEKYSAFRKEIISRRNITRNKKEVDKLILLRKDILQMIQEILQQA